MKRRSFATIGKLIARAAANGGMTDLHAPDDDVRLLTLDLQRKVGEM